MTNVINIATVISGLALSSHLENALQREFARQKKPKETKRSKMMRMPANGKGPAGEQSAFSSLIPNRLSC